MKCRQLRDGPGNSVSGETKTIPDSNEAKIRKLAANSNFSCSFVLGGKDMFDEIIVCKLDALSG